ncbi:MAG: Ig-like domain-containing protein, partial [Erysipelotrichaceae bacterium]|nr:Ig-like domain-containing protein [Erysipelotrichaceae bacterium]
MGYYPENNETWTAEAKVRIASLFDVCIWQETEKTIRVTFSILGTAETYSIYAAPDTYLERPELIGEEGYYINDWFTSEEMTVDTKWDFESDTVTEDIVLYGMWEPVRVASVTLDTAEAVMRINETLKINCLIEPSNALNKQVAWVSDHEDVALADENGLITALKAGTAVITVTTEDGSMTASCMITVIDKDAYPGIYISGLESSYTYTGSAIKPEITVYDTGVMLTPKIDYTVTYKNTTKAYTVADPEHPTAADKKKAPQIIIKSNSKSNYTGSKTVYFSIEPLDFSDEQITVDDLCVQVGTKPVTAVPAVYFNGKKLRHKADYKVNDTGWDRKEPGKYTITVEGNGNFKGSREVNVFAASKEYVSASKLKVTVKTLKYADLTEENFEEKIVGAVTVKNGKTELTYGSDYLIFGITTEQIMVGTHPAVLMFNDEKGYYGTKGLMIKITGIALTDKKVKSAEGLSYPYTGKEVRIPEGTSLLTYCNGSLTEGTDYVIDSYAGNINAGTATATLKGINNFTGTKKITFKITPADALGREIKVEDAYYTKGGSKPKVTVEGLTEGTDFTVKYADNKAVTTPNTSKLPGITVTFKGNYKGTVRKDFFIEPKPISTVSITAKDLVYKKGKYQSTPVLTDTDGKKLKAGTDYEKTITYTTVDGDELPAVVEPDTVVKVTVTGKGNYTGTAETFYRILKTGKDISKLTFKIA